MYIMTAYALNKQDKVIIGKSVKNLEANFFISPQRYVVCSLITTTYQSHYDAMQITLFQLSISAGVTGIM